MVRSLFGWLAGGLHGWWAGQGARLRRILQRGPLLHPEVHAAAFDLSICLLTSIHIYMRSYLLFYSFTSISTIFSPLGKGPLLVLQTSYGTDECIMGAGSPSGTSNAPPLGRTSASWRPRAWLLDRWAGSFFGDEVPNRTS